MAWSDAQVDRARGAVLGSAAGDALGAAYEFECAAVGPDPTGATLTATAFDQQRQKGHTGGNGSLMRTTPRTPACCGRWRSDTPS